MTIDEKQNWTRMDPDSEAFAQWVATADSEQVSAALSSLGVDREAALAMYERALTKARQYHRANEARSSALSRWAGVTVGLAAAIVVAWSISIAYPPTLGLVERRGLPDPSYRARGQSSDGPAFEKTRAQDLQVWVGAHRIVQGHPSEKIHAFSRDTALGFSFRNSLDHVYRYLAVFAVDRYGRVEWFFPEEETTLEGCRSSVAIQSSIGWLPDTNGDSDADMIEFVHDLPAGPAFLYAVFTPDPLDACILGRQAIESMPEGWESAQRVRRLPIPDSAQWARKWTVTP